MSMNVKERKQVMEAWAEQCKQKKQHLMVQVGGAALPDVIKLVIFNIKQDCYNRKYVYCQASHAEKNGADSILCLPELFQKATTHPELIQYLQIVAKAAPNTPLLYYHIPRMTNVNINMGAFLSSVGNGIPTLCGIKFSSTVLDEGLAAVKADNERFCVFLGAHAVMAGAYTLGFRLAIATTQNLFPQFGELILKSVLKGDLNKAQETQNNLNRALTTISKYGPFVPSTKAALQILSSVQVGSSREPFKPISVEKNETNGN